jgi:hypothetical protein
MTSYKTPAYKGLRSAGKISSHLTRTLVSKKENFLASILYDWALIVGDKYAHNLTPERISFPKTKNTGATLHLSVSNGSMALMAHHLQPLILSKLNQFVGYQAFEKIILHQSKTAPQPTTLGSSHRHTSLSLSEKEELDLLLSQTPEGDLKEALQKLGESLYLDRKNSK